MEGVAGEDDPALDRDLLAAQAVRVAVPVPALVLRPHRRREMTETDDRRDHLRPDLRVAPHDLPLLVIQRTRLLEHGVGHSDLPDVVQKRDLADSPLPVELHVEDLRHVERELHHRVAVPARVAVADLEGGEERAHPRCLDLAPAVLPLERTPVGGEPVVLDAIGDQARQHLEHADLALTERAVRPPAEAAEIAEHLPVRKPQRHADVGANPLAAAGVGDRGRQRPFHDAARALVEGDGVPHFEPEAQCVPGGRTVGLIAPVHLRDVGELHSQQLARSVQLRPYLRVERNESPCHGSPLPGCQTTRAVCASYNARAPVRRDAQPTLEKLSAHDEIHEFSRYNDGLDDLPAVEPGRQLLGFARYPLLLLLGCVGRRLEAVDQLAVHLDDERNGVRHEQVPVGLRPRFLPDAPAGQLLVDLGAEVRREGEDQRGGRGDREADV